MTRSHAVLLVVPAFLGWLCGQARGGDLPIDFEGLPATQILTSGPIVPDPASVVTDEFANLGVVFGYDGVSTGVAVVQDSLAPSSGVNSVSGLDEAGILPGGLGALIGDIHFRFVAPGTDTDAETDFVEFTIGDAGGDLDEFRIRGFDVGGAQVYGEIVSGEARFTVTIDQPGIHRVEVGFFGSSGYSLDDLDFDEPEAPECFLVIGNGVGDAPFASDTFVFQTQLANVLSSHAVLMEDVPWFVLPSAPSAILTGASTGLGHGGSVTGGYWPDFVGPDGTFTAQVMMWNPVDVPQAPEQYSQVLSVWIAPDGSLHARPVGTGTIDIELLTRRNAQGDTLFSFPFTIPGF